MSNFIRTSIRFIRRDLWRIRLRELSPRHGFWLRNLRVFVLSLREFGADKCALRASALTYYTLLAIVPVLAMAFGVAKGFGLAEKLEEEIRSKFSSAQASGEQAVEVGNYLQDVVDQIIGFANNMLASVRGGLVAGVGVVVLFYVIIKVLGNIEKSFNDIWAVQKGRSLARKFSDYLAFMMVSPIVLLLAQSMTVAAVTQVEEFLARWALWGWLVALIEVLLKVVPLSLLWALFSFSYLFMPNAKVKVSSGIIGGVVAGTLFILAQWAYLYFQIGVSRYNAIYGSFAALPFFLVWLQTSWLIVLYGAEVAFAHQNVDTYEMEPDCEQASHAFRREVALWVVHRCVRAFEKEEPALSATALGHEIGAPRRLINPVLFDLVRVGILSQVYQEEDEEYPVYQPACTISHLSVAAVLDRIDLAGVDNMPLNEDKAMERIRETLASLRAARRKNPENRLLSDL